jgi:hypothetical protein
MYKRALVPLDGSSVAEAIVAVLAACTKTRVGCPGGGPRTSISTAGA